MNGTGFMWDFGVGAHDGQASKDLLFIRFEPIVSGCIESTSVPVW